MSKWHISTHDKKVTVASPWKNKMNVGFSSSAGVLFMFWNENELILFLFSFPLDSAVSAVCSLQKWLEKKERKPDRLKISSKP